MGGVHQFTAHSEAFLDDEFGTLGWRAREHRVRHNEKGTD
jgi:hypothetical protein